jgi:hypothetical protein
VLADDGGGGRAGRGGAREVLTGDGGVAMRHRTGGNELRWLELVARAEEGVKKLRREGTRCGEGRGVSSPFYRCRGAPERGGRGGVMAALMALTPLKTRARLRGGLRGGGEMVAGRVLARPAFEGEAGRRRVAGDEEEKRQRSVGVRKGMELTCGPHLAVM